jgi:CSLREA domain-containing protein
VVNSSVDPGDGTCNARQCTLREAINEPQSTEVSFAAGLTGPITLAKPGAGGGPLEIEKTLTITGPSSKIVIQRRSTDPEFRILRIGSGATVGLTNLILRNGKTDRVGAGIVNFGTLALTNCRVAGNSSTAHGGGIDNQGALTLTHSTVANNSAPFGGGIHNHSSSTLTVRHSTITHNSGGGVGNLWGALTLTNSTVSYNNGGGIGLSGGQATLGRLTILGNTGGGISNFNSTTTLANSTVAGNSAGDGGGISNGADRQFTITNSTIVNNSASGRGGGIFNTVGDPFGRLSSHLTLTNSTVTGNSAATGGGIESSDRRGGAQVSVSNSTIARNSARNEGGGIRTVDGFDNSNSVFLTNSLVARNTAPTAPDVRGAGARYSLIGDGTGSGISNTDGNQVGNVSPNTSPIDPKIGPLANNGGPTRTHALQIGSPAIDAASTPDCPATDQRGVLRPQGARCDIGSYERR